MTAGEPIAQTGTYWQQFISLFVVVLCATCGGMLVQVLMKGVDIKSGSVGPIKIKPVLTCITIPPLVGMIIFGCLARNFLGQEYMQHYPNITASWVRMICLSIILLRGGLELDFKGKGMTVVLLTLVPQFMEAAASGVASRYIFGLPWPLCFAQGFTLAAVSPAVLVPSLMILQKAKYGTKKGIPTTLIAASSFDDIIAITIFGIFLTVAMNEAPGGIAEEGDSIGFEVLYNLIQIVTGLVLGLAIGYTMRLFNKCSVTKTKWPKFFVCLLMAFAVPIISELTTFHEAKFIGIIFFGFMCYQAWGEDKPEHELGVFWSFCQPFLFGTVGAAVLFEKIEPSLIGKGLLVIFIGVTCRWFATFFAVCEKKFTYKERAFMAFAWIPKATVQAALGGITLAEAQKRGIKEYEEYGQAMLTTAVFAICITAPLGAIFINTLGTKWLTYDGDDAQVKASDVEANAAKDPAPSLPTERELISSESRNDNQIKPVVTEENNNEPVVQPSDADRAEEPVVQPNDADKSKQAVEP